MEEIITLEKYLKDNSEKYDEKLGDLILKIGEIGERISKELPNRRGKADTKNVFGEVQLVADKWADKFAIDEFRGVGIVKAMISEEREGVVKLNENGIFDITLDPLDGSSNIETNNSVGTIFGIYKADLPCEGKNQICAAYILYGPVMTLIFATENSVNEFLHTEQGFVLKQENIKLPEPGILYGIGGLRKDWLPEFREYVEELEAEGYKLRYGGSFVGDFNQILHYGGIFAYPALASKPEGKLRLFAESNPMSYIIKQAGGASTDGAMSILDIKPDSVNQRTPTYIGNKGLIEKLESLKLKQK